MFVGLQHRPLDDRQNLDDTASSHHFSPSEVAHALAGDTATDSSPKESPANKGLLGLLFGRTFGGRY